MELTVLKVGGSLLDLSDLGARLETLFGLYASTRTIVFPGGGATADLVRGWQTRWKLDDDAAHELAIHSLSLNAQLLSRIVPRSAVVTNLPEAEKVWSREMRPILDPQSLLEIFERDFPETAPPHVWEVTSDSLAAWTAERLGAERLILAKSVELAPGTRLLDAVKREIVDPYFPGIAGLLPRVDWCCLRHERPTLQQWML